MVVQAMVFGNLGGDSGTGVLFSRNPATGADEPLGEWLPRAQGEDVVSGTSDCLPLDALRVAQPQVFTELIAAANQLEKLGRDVQDIEFTVEEGRLWLLQTRAAKRSPQAAVRLLEGRGLARLPIVSPPARGLGGLGRQPRARRGRLRGRGRTLRQRAHGQKPRHDPVERDPASLAARALGDPEARRGAADCGSETHPRALGHAQRLADPRPHRCSAARW